MIFMFEVYIVTGVLDEDNENESSEQEVGAPGERVLGVITVSIRDGQYFDYRDNRD